jgi:hypothetical protein
LPLIFTSLNSTSTSCPPCNCDAGTVPPTEVSAGELPDWLNAHAARLRLACGDVGVGALAPLEQIAEMVGRMRDDLA